jgi:phage-related protein
MKALLPLPHKPLRWVGRARDELMSLPENVRRGVGYALRFAQAGVTPENVKPLKGFGGAVYLKWWRILTATLTVQSSL